MVLAYDLEKESDQGTRKNDRVTRGKKERMLQDAIGNLPWSRLLASPKHLMK